MDVSEKWGTDVEAAVNLALDELKATRDEVEVTVLEQPSRGFFGIGSKLALVRVERKKEEPKEEVNNKINEIQDEEVNQNCKCEIESSKEEVGNGDEAPKLEEKKCEKASIEDFRESSPYNIKKDTLNDLENHEAIEFLNDLTTKMGLSVSIESKTDGKNIYFFIEGKDSATIIGKRGQTLDSIQYLTSLVVNKNNKEYVRVIVDAENYRSKREKTLERLALRLADKVVKTGRSVKFEPMNPYERKVIHSTLQTNGKIVTRSEGLDPYRRVIIEMK